jgi:glutamate dehydrogenase (NAD(P)+)
MLDVFRANFARATRYNPRHFPFTRAQGRRRDVDTRADFARLIQEDGVVLVGVVERDGSLSAPDGMDINDVLQWRQDTGSMRDFPAATTLDHATDCLELACDIVVPAALEHQITRDNAARIRAPLIAEAANSPTTADADAMLRHAGKVILPDMFVNAGGVAVSYFAWVKNLSHMRFGRMAKRVGMQTQQRMIAGIEELTGGHFSPAPREDITHGIDELELVNSGLEETMIRGLQDILTIMHEQQTEDLRTAAFICALRKMVTAYEALGIWP